MKWHAVLAGALASALAASVAAADMRIVADQGGEVTTYLQKFMAVRASGERVIIDGPCMSACTLLFAVVPKDRICVTNRAVLGFHGAAYYDDATRSLVPTREGSRLVMRLYPLPLRSWIERHGGLTPKLIKLRGPELAALYGTCR